MVEQLAYIQRVPGSSPGVPISFERSYPNHIHIMKRPVEMQGVLYLSKNVDLRTLFFYIISVMMKENVCGRNEDDSDFKLSRK